MSAVKLSNPQIRLMLKMLLHEREVQARAHAAGNKVPLVVAYAPRGQQGLSVTATSLERKDMVHVVRVGINREFDGAWLRPKGREVIADILHNDDCWLAYAKRLAMQSPPTWRVPNAFDEFG